MSVQVNSRLIPASEMVNDIKNLLTYDSNFAIWTKLGTRSPISVVDIATNAGFKVFVVNDMRRIDGIAHELKAAKLDGLHVVVVFTKINEFFDLYYSYWTVFTEMLTLKRVCDVQLDVDDVIVAIGQLSAEGKPHINKNTYQDVVLNRFCNINYPFNKS